MLTCCLPPIDVIFALAKLHATLKEFYGLSHNQRVGNGAAHYQEAPMCVIELNFAGHQFTHRVPDRRRPLFRFATRGMNWRPAQLRNQHAV